MNSFCGTLALPNFIHPYLNLVDLKHWLRITLGRRLVLTLECLVDLLCQLLLKPPLLLGHLLPVDLNHGLVGAAAGLRRVVRTGGGLEMAGRAGGVEREVGSARTSSEVAGCTCCVFHGVARSTRSCLKLNRCCRFDLQMVGSPCSCMKIVGSSCSGLQVVRSSCSGL